MSWGVWDHGGWDRGIFVFFTLHGALVFSVLILIAVCLALIYGIKR